MTSTRVAVPLALATSLLRRLASSVIMGGFQRAILRQYVEKSTEAVD
jgi:hypothetical protein